MLGLSCLDTSPQLNCRWRAIFQRSAEVLKCMCLYPLYPDSLMVMLGKGASILADSMGQHVNA